MNIKTSLQNITFKKKENKGKISWATKRIQKIVASYS
jgi:hypothetical protein